MRFTILTQKLRQSSRSICSSLSKCTTTIPSSDSIFNPRTQNQLSHPRFNHPSLSSNPSIHSTNVRNFSNEPESGLDHSKEIDEINLKFAEAREDIESAMDSKETVYFDEEAECARATVTDVLDMFNALLAKLPENEKGALQRAMGLKIEQLKAELAQLDE
ncbi:hypothetical protein ACHQM5_017456 [Ranunculus cassubicifolius]